MELNNYLIMLFSYSEQYVQLFYVHVRIYVIFDHDILIRVYNIAVVADSRAKVIIKQQTINEQYNSDSESLR